VDLPTWAAYQDFVTVLIVKIVLEPESLAHLLNEMSETPFVLVHPAPTGQLLGCKSNRT